METRRRIPALELILIRSPSLSLSLSFHSLLSVARALGSNNTRTRLERVIRPMPAAPFVLFFLISDVSTDEAPSGRFFFLPPFVTK